MAATFDEVFALPTDHRVALGQSAHVLRGFAHSRFGVIVADMWEVVQQAPFRHMVTPGGDVMSVAMSNCGRLGWITDRTGYCYSPVDPLTGETWPSMPESFARLAQAAAAEAGFNKFIPDACLINRYKPGTRLSLHQDKDERDFAAPIVSVSLGLTATFLFGGHKRSDRPQRISLVHGDVVVWGGDDRLRFHGVAPLKEAVHPVLGCQRINLTFRRAG